MQIQTLLTKKQNAFVVTGPSGVGKSAIISSVFKRVENLTFSVSATTRKPREGEQNGVDYFFLSREDFLQKVANNEFVEHVEKYGNLYGTLANCIEQNGGGKDIILDLEVNGARALKQKHKENITSIFILPPSQNTQIERLRQRNDGDESFNHRVSQFKKDVSNLDEYDYIIINDILEDSVDTFVSIVNAKRACKSSFIDLKKIVSHFTAS